MEKEDIKEDTKEPVVPTNTAEQATEKPAKKPCKVAFPMKKHKKFCTTFTISNSPRVSDLMFAGNVCRRYGIELINIETKDGKHTGEFENNIASRVDLEYDKQVKSKKRDFIDASRLMNIYYSEYADSMTDTEICKAIDGKIKSMFELGCIPTVIYIEYGSGYHYSRNDHINPVKRVSACFEKVVDKDELQDTIDAYNSGKADEDKIFVFKKKHRVENDSCSSKQEDTGHGCLLALSAIMLVVGAIMFFTGLHMKHKYSIVVDKAYQECIKRE